VFKKVLKTLVLKGNETCRRQQSVGHVESMSKEGVHAKFGGETS
jgi:hypothetical protein